MTRQALTGIALALGALLAFGLGGIVGSEIQSVALLGLAAGAAIGLVPDATPGARAAAFLIGVVLAWVGYLLRAVALPDATSGRLVALVAIVVLVTVAAAVSVGRLPLWATLLGAGALGGAYEGIYAANPTAFLTTSPQQVTAILLTAAVGFAVTVLLQPVGTTHAAEPAHARRDDDAVAPRPLETVPEA